MPHHEIREVVTDWMFTNFPCLLQDDYLVEGFVHFVACLVERAVREERARRIRALLDPGTLEAN